MDSGCLRTQTCRIYTEQNIPHADIMERQLCGNEYWRADRRCRPVTALRECPLLGSEIERAYVVIDGRAIVGRPR